MFPDGLTQCSRFWKVPSDDSELTRRVFRKTSLCYPPCETGPIETSAGQRDMLVMGCGGPGGRGDTLVMVYGDLGEGAHIGHGVWRHGGGEAR